MTIITSGFIYNIRYMFAGINQFYVYLLPFLSCIVIQIIKVLDHNLTYNIKNIGK
jgi:hypothetical protein